MPTNTRTLLALAGGLAWTIASVTPALGQSTAGHPDPHPSSSTAQEQEARSTTERGGDAIRDSWITMKVHSQFIPEDALEDSDIDVDTNNGVVTLTGTVPTSAAKTRAVALAKATDGVKSVNDRLRIGPPERYDVDAPVGTAGREAGESAREGGRETEDAAREAGRETSDAAREAGDETREAARGTSNAMTNGWIKSKIYSQFITEDALNDSDVDLDVARGVVTLNGTVASAAAKQRAEQIAKATDGVRSVRNNLTVGQARER